MIWLGLRVSQNGAPCHSIQIKDVRLFLCAGKAIRGFKNGKFFFFFSDLVCGCSLGALTMNSHDALLFTVLSVYSPLWAAFISHVCHTGIAFPLKSSPPSACCAGVIVEPGGQDLLWRPSVCSDKQTWKQKVLVHLTRLLSHRCERQDSHANKYTADKQTSHDLTAHSHCDIKHMEVGGWGD